MNGRMKRISAAVVLIVVVVGLLCAAGCKKKEEAAPASPNAVAKDVLSAAADIEQTVCPVMGQPINKEFFTEYEGKKVYFCCAGCKEKFEAEPAKYLAKLPQFKK